jgi:hypothetical protein
MFPSQGEKAFKDSTAIKAHTLFFNMLFGTASGLTAVATKVYSY